jgi:hypothetical protein
MKRTWRHLGLKRSRAEGEGAGSRREGAGAVERRRRRRRRRWDGGGDGRRRSAIGGGGGGLASRPPCFWLGLLLPRSLVVGEMGGGRGLGLERRGGAAVDEATRSLTRVLGRGRGRVSEEEGLSKRKRGTKDVLLGCRSAWPGRERGFGSGLFEFVGCRLWISLIRVYRNCCPKKQL